MHLIRFSEINFNFLLYYLKYTSNVAYKSIYLIYIDTHVCIYIYGKL